jgi:hypothetical protein
MQDIQKIMGLSVQNLAKEQHTALKGHVVKVIKSVLKIIEDEKYEEVGNFLADSPSGDGYGCDNSYVDFSYEKNTCLDIEEVVAKLISLKIASK